MRRALLGLALGLSACGWQPLHADDPSQDGEVAVVKLTEEPPPPLRKHGRSRHDDDDAGPARAAVMPAPFYLDDLPRAVLSPPVGVMDAPEAASPPPSDLLVRREGPRAELRVRAPKRALTALTIDNVTSEALSVRCRPHEPKRALRWEVLEPLPDGDARYSVVDAWFFGDRCAAHVKSRSTFRARGLVPHLLYGLRQCADPACTGDPRLLVLAPPMVANTVHQLALEAISLRTWPFTKATFTVVHGAGESLAGEIEEKTLVKWLGENRPVWARPLRDVLVGVDVAQSVHEPSPIGLAHVAADALLTEKPNGIPLHRVDDP